MREVPGPERADGSGSSGRQNLQLESIWWERWWAVGSGHRGYPTSLTGVKADTDEEMYQAYDVTDGFEAILRSLQKFMFCCLGILNI